ncbi:MAG TPA: TetR family transcriptional regulator [Bacillales bacterium]|nr:TetR family transcriptional regulator [Bacillales bacterium]
MPKVSREHIEKRKSEILEAALTVFSRKGFEPTTMRDIVEESGMSRGGVYQYFSSPEEMLEAIHERNIHRTADFVRELLSQNETVWGALEDYLAEISGESRYAMVIYEYSMTSWRNERHRRFMNNVVRGSFQAFEALLQQGVDNGEFRPTQSLDAIVSFLINVGDGLSFQASILGNEAAHVQEQVEGLKIYLRTVLQVREEPRI